MIKFGTSGFRAIIAEDFTKENVQKVAQGLAKIIRSEKFVSPVIIGYDRRFLSAQFARWFAEVLAGNKIQAKLYSNPVPTPTVMYTVKEDNLDYGIIITASHNPYAYNGLKICIKGGKDAQIDLTSRLEKIVNGSIKIKSLDYPTAVANKLITTFDNTPNYIKNIIKQISPNLKGKPIKVLFNAMYGVTSECAEMFAKALKLENFHIINSETDPYFKNILPCPNEESLEDFKKQVTKGRYNIGIACDADGDRIGIIDEKGEYHGCNELIAIVYYYLVKYRNLKGDIVKNYATSIFLDKLAETFGQKCHETPVGFKWISSKMEETDAIIGGESSGGFTIKDYTPTKDSMLAVALVLDAMATINKPFTKILQEVKNFCGYISTYKEGNIEIKNKKKFLKMINKTSPNFSYKPTKVINFDGKKYVFEDGSWICIRFSGTENLIRYYLEFPTEIECERNLKAILNFIKNAN